MNSAYELAGIIPLLDAIRTPGRYRGANGINVLTNATPMSEYDKDSVIRELRRAEAAGLAKESCFQANFDHPMQGLAYGLNPYTDWALSQLEAPPSHWYLFLGLDWYAVSGLGQTNRWFDYIANPFLDTEDKYWHNLWAWILRKIRTNPEGTASWDVPVRQEDAAAFIKADGGGFLFHNRIPYLRPAGFESSGSDWYEAEWKKPGVKADILEDLRLIWELTKGRVVAYCTGQESADALLAVGFPSASIHSWGAHPSRVFHPSRFLKQDFWFGPAHVGGKAVAHDHKVAKASISGQPTSASSSGASMRQVVGQPIASSPSVQKMFQAIETHDHGSLRIRSLGWEHLCSLFNKLGHAGFTQALVEGCYESALSLKVVQGEVSIFSNSSRLTAFYANLAVRKKALEVHFQAGDPRFAALQCKYETDTIEAKYQSFVLRSPEIVREFFRDLVGIT